MEFIDKFESTESQDREQNLVTCEIPGIREALDFVFRIPASRELLGVIHILQSHGSGGSDKKSLQYDIGGGRPTLHLWGVGGYKKTTEPALII